MIVGQGNVAIDCARILSKTPAELATTDIAAHALAALSASKVRRVHVLGRRGHVQASFTMKELREVTKLEDAACLVSVGELERGRTASSVAEMAEHRAKKRMDELLSKVAGGDAAGKARSLSLRFLLSPTALLPSHADPGAVGAVACDVTALSGEANAQRASPTGATEIVPAGMVLKSIGYKSVSLPGVPFDDKAAVVRNTRGRVHDASNVNSSGLYVAGWLKRGPSGIIGTNIPDARETVGCILEDAAGGVLPAVTAPHAGMAGLRALLSKAGRTDASLVDWAGFLAINAAEVAAGAAEGRPRQKITRVEEMLKVAGAKSA